MPGGVTTQKPSLRTATHAAASGSAAAAGADVLVDPMAAAELRGDHGHAAAAVGRAHGHAHGGASVGPAGLQAAAGVGAQASVLDASAAGAVGSRALGASAAGKGELLSAAANGNAKLSANKDGFSAGAAGDVGAHLARGDVAAEGGFTIPFTNIRLGGNASAQGSIGAGASGGANFSAGADGFSMGVNGSASLGIGGGFGLGFSVSKANKDAGWFS